MRSVRLAGLATAVLLAGCNKEPPLPPEVAQTSAAVEGVPQNGDIGTPVKDRVATVGLLNKRNNVVQDLQLKSGESKRVGNVVVRVATCENTPPWEDPPETGAFVQLYVEERRSTAERLAWHKVFSGWLFKNNPSLNVVEHPAYDVWVKACSMTFPGEMESPSAAASKAAKPAGSASGTAPPSVPKPTASASASPTPSSRPTPTASPTP